MWSTIWKRSWGGCPWLPVQKRDRSCGPLSSLHSSFARTTQTALPWGSWEDQDFPPFPVPKFPGRHQTSWGTVEDWCLSVHGVGDRALKWGYGESRVALLLISPLHALLRRWAERAAGASDPGGVQPHRGLRAAAGRADHQPMLLGFTHGRAAEPAVAGPQQHCALHCALTHQPRLHDLQRRLPGPLLVPPLHHRLGRRPQEGATTASWDLCRRIFGTWM